MKKLVSLLLGAIIIMSVSSCTNFESSKKEKETALTVGKYDVPYEMLRYASLNAMEKSAEANEITIDDEFISSEAGAEFSKKALESGTEKLKTIYGVFALGEEYGIDYDGEAISSLVDTKMDEAEAEYESNSDFKSSLDSHYMTKNVLRILKTYDAVYEELYDAMIFQGDIVTDEEKLNEIFRSDELIRVKELCFSTERHTIEECRILADEAYEALINGADFDTYVYEHGESLAMFKNTDGHYITRGIWETALEDKAFSMEIGEMSEPVEASDGVRILLRCEKSSEYIEKHFDTICDTYEEGIFRRKIEGAIAEAAVSLKDGYKTMTVYEMKDEH